jgi:phage terminase large subunit-like protein
MLSDSDVDIGMKASMYTSATLKEMYTVGITLRNKLHNCISAWYKNWPPQASYITGLMLMC